jgi:tRNA(adenine34) deaminase
MDDREGMRLALEQARRAAELGEVPVGAVVVRGDEILGVGHNRREVDQDPLAHAELLALRQAAGRGTGWRLLGCTMFVTLEPCAMCAGALVNSRVERLVFGAHDAKAGFCGSLGDLARDPRLNHRLDVVPGVLADECGALLRGFFRGLRGEPSGSL